MQFSIEHISSRFALSLLNKRWPINQILLPTDADYNDRKISPQYAQAVCNSIRNFYAKVCSNLVMQLRRTFYKTAVNNRGVGGASIGVYNAVFNKYLIVTNTATCGILMAVGDLMQQEIEYRRNMIENRYDWARLSRMFLVGMSLGPAHHFFYKYMDHYLPRKNLLAVIKKIILDQLVMSPFCIAWFFYGMGTLEKKTTAQCTEELNSKFVEVYTIDWSVWPPAQFLNFYFLKVQYQVIYINFITMFYNVFLSYVKHRETAENYKRTHFRMH